MENKFIMIKIKKSEAKLMDLLEESYKKKVSKIYYGSKSLDQKQLMTLELEQTLNIVFITFGLEDDDYKVSSLYVGIGKLEVKEEQRNIVYNISHKIEAKLIVENFILSSGINLKTDFIEDSYIIFENANTIYRKLFDSVSTFEKNNLFKSGVKYGELPCIKPSPLLQKNEYCIRCFNGINNNENEHRGEFQRDRERILHSKSFRRLVDKAQIFTSKKGDHFRTRMTHTLEVSQIARGLARDLGVNEDLTEAIALAHDIGHTPFGHQGERTLQRLLKNELEKLPQNMRSNRRFKHNFQGLKVVTSLEEKYLEHDGLNLSYQVLEGILKHTDSCLKKNKDCICTHHCVEIDDFLQNEESKYLYLDYRYPTTIEGQIVRIADEIAQRGHDLDDAFASKLLSYENFKDICNISKFFKIKDLIEAIDLKSSNLAEKSRYFIDIHDLKRAELVSAILGLLITDVVDTSKINMEKFDTDNELFNEHKRINSLLVTFSDDMHFIVNYLENEIKKKVINSNEVAVFDDSAEKIITKVFNSYLNNPKLLPNSTLRRLFYEFKNRNLSVIDFRDGDLGLIADELAMIKSIPYDTELMLEYAEKYDILVHCIIDHISGMTDNYAINEYEKLK